MTCCAPSVDADAEEIVAASAGEEALVYAGDKQMQFLGDSEKTMAFQETMKNIELGDIRDGVALPDGEDLNLWLANYTLYFFNRTFAVWETFRPFVTKENSPVMCADGGKYEYYWADGDTVKRPIKLSAPEYIAKDLAWTQKELDDETIFPQTSDGSFSPRVMSHIRIIFKRLFRIYAHCFTMHTDHVSDDGQLSFKHFVLLVLEYNLIDRNELSPMQDFIDKLDS